MSSLKFDKKEKAVTLGIVLKTTPIGESNLRLNILTSSGIITVTATGAQKTTAKLKSAVQLFTIAEFIITGTRLTGAHVIISPMPLTREINRYYLACSIAETILLTQNHDEQMFYLTARTYETLSSTKTSAYKVFINFFTKLLLLLGFDINIDKKFKEIENERIDEIKIDLATAKTLVTKINTAYQEHLSITISCTAQFTK